MNNSGMTFEYLHLLEDVFGNNAIWNAGCSDMGDMASLMLTKQAYVGGACGTEHGSDYRICDPETACVDAAKIQLIALKLLLENDAQKAKEATIASYNPYFKNKSEYFAYINRIERDCDAVIYKDDGNVLLNIGSI